MHHHDKLSFCEERQNEIKLLSYKLPDMTLVIRKHHSRVCMVCDAPTHYKHHKLSKYGRLDFKIPTFLYKNETLIARDILYV